MPLPVGSISRNTTASFLSILFISRPQKLFQTWITSVFPTSFKRGKSVWWLWYRRLNWCKECSRAWIYELQSHLWWQHGLKTCSISQSQTVAKLDTKSTATPLFYSGLFGLGFIMLLSSYLFLLNSGLDQAMGFFYEILSLLLNSLNHFLKDGGFSDVILLLAWPHTSVKKAAGSFCLPLYFKLFKIAFKYQIFACRKRRNFSRAAKHRAKRHFPPLLFSSLLSELHPSLSGSGKCKGDWASML